MILDSPSDFAGADVRPDTLAVRAGQWRTVASIIVLADRHRARVLGRRSSAVCYSEP